MRFIKYICFSYTSLSNLGCMQTVKLSDCFLLLFFNECGHWIIIKLLRARSSWIYVCFFRPKRTKKRRRIPCHAIYLSFQWKLAFLLFFFLSFNSKPQIKTQLYIGMEHQIECTKPKWHGGSLWSSFEYNYHYPHNIDFILIDFRLHLTNRRSLN